MKSVTFEPSVMEGNNNNNNSKNVIIPPPPEPLGPDEMESVWYSPKELAEILSTCHAIADGDGSICYAESSGETTVRGLELLSCGKETYQLRNEVISDVLEEQERLLKKEKKSVHDEEYIQTLAEIERQHSQHRQRIAHLRALQDAQVVHGMGMALVGGEGRAEGGSSFSSSQSNNNTVLSKVDRSEIRERRRSERTLRRQLSESLMIAE